MPTFRGALLAAGGDKKYYKQTNREQTEKEDIKPTLNMCNFRREQGNSDKYMNISSFGDYNFPGVNWFSGGYSGQVQTWSEFCDEFCLLVMNCEATRKEIYNYFEHKA